MAKQEQNSSKEQTENYDLLFDNWKENLEHVLPLLNEITAMRLQTKPEILKNKDIRKNLKSIPDTKSSKLTLSEGITTYELNNKTFAGHEISSKLTKKEDISLPFHQNINRTQPSGPERTYKQDHLRLIIRNEILKKYKLDIETDKELINSEITRILTLTNIKSLQRHASDSGASFDNDYKEWLNNPRETLSTLDANPNFEPKETRTSLSRCLTILRKTQNTATIIYLRLKPKG